MKTVFMCDKNAFSMDICLALREAHINGRKEMEEDFTALLELANEMSNGVNFANRVKRFRQWKKARGIE